MLFVDKLGDQRRAEKALTTGRARRDPAVGELEVYAGPTLAIGENAEPLREFVKPHLALYIGGVGA